MVLRYFFFHRAARARLSGRVYRTIWNMECEMARAFWPRRRRWGWYARHGDVYTRIRGVRGGAEACAAVVADRDAIDLLSCRRAKGSVGGRGGWRGGPADRRWQPCECVCIWCTRAVSRSFYSLHAAVTIVRATTLKIVIIIIIIILIFYTTTMTVIIIILYNRVGNRYIIWVGRCTLL